MKGRSRAGRRLFVLDTNVLMHDPTAIFRFEEHDVYLPMVVLEELDAAQEGPVGSLAQRAPGEPLPRRHDARRHQGADRPRPAAAERLLRQSRQEALHRPAVLPDAPAGRARCRKACPATAPTTRSSAQTLALQNEQPDARVILVSKDINLRIKAAVLGVHAEDYYSDKTIEDADVLYSGMTALPDRFLGAARQGHALLEGSRPHLLRAHRARGARVAAEPGSSTRTRPRASRASCAASAATRRRSS